MEIKILSINENQKSKFKIFPFKIKTEELFQTFDHLNTI